MSKALRDVMSVMGWYERIGLYGFERFESDWAEDHGEECVSRERLFEGKSIKPYLLEDNIRIVAKGAHLPDYLRHVPLYMPIVSGYMKNVLLEAGVENVEWYRVPVERIGNYPYEEEDYWLINILSVLDATDWENSIYHPTETVFRGPRKGQPVLDTIYLDESKTGDFSIFRNRQLPFDIFVSDSVAEAIMEAECTGVAVCEPHQVRWSMISDLDGVHHAYEHGWRDVDKEDAGAVAELGKRRAIAERDRFWRLFQERHPRKAKPKKRVGE